MKLKRLLINGMLAATFGLSAVAVESGALNSLATIALAATTTTTSTSTAGSVSPVTQSNPKGSTATVTGTYVWTTDASFLITVTTVMDGKITQVSVTANGKTVSLAVSGSNPIKLFDSGLSLSFSKTGVNKKGDTYAFSATAAHKCEGKPSKCDS